MRMIQIVFLLAMFAIFASAQTMPSETLTKAEEQEAVKVAKLFEKRMNVGKDVTPILKELFVKDFLNRYLQDEKNYPIPYVKHVVAVKLKTSDLRRYFISSVNFEYLTSIYFLNNFYVGRDGDEPTFEESYPPGVAALVKKFYPQEKNEYGAVDDPKIETNGQLLCFIETQDKATNLVRDYLKKHPLNFKSETYLKNVRELGGRPNGPLYEPSITISQKERFAFPAETKMIRINTVVYQLLLVRDDGKLKIINLASGS